MVKLIISCQSCANGKLDLAVEYTALRAKIIELRYILNSIAANLQVDTLVSQQKAIIYYV